MAIISLKQANNVYAQHKEKIAEEVDRLTESINEAIMSHNAWQKENPYNVGVSTWYFSGVSTDRVVYLDVSEYFDESIKIVSDELANEGFICNVLKMANINGGSMNIMAIVWDLDVVSDIFSTPLMNDAFYDMGEDEQIEIVEEDEDEEAQEEQTEHEEYEEVQEDEAEAEVETETSNDEQVAQF